MAQKKNPAAVALGRKGGKVRGVAKGFAADPEKAREAGKKSGETRRKKAAKKTLAKKTGKSKDG